MNSYFEVVQEQLKDWKVAVLVLIFTAARLVYGWAWLSSGLHKLTWLSDGQINAAGFIQSMINNLAGPQVTRFDPLMINNLFAWVAQNFFLGIPSVVDFMVVVFEISIGVALILGYRVFWFSLIALFMNTQFMAGGSFNNFGYIWSDIAFMGFAGKAELLGLSGYLKFRNERLERSERFYPQQNSASRI